MNGTTRREFFGKAIGGIMGFIGLGLALPLLGYAILPTLKRREDSWSDAGPIDQLEVNRPKELEVVRSVKNGWMQSDSVKAIWGFRDSEGKIVVYSAVCPHLGCGYQWSDEKKNFLCPCHNSAFGLSGGVLSGPAPRPLDRLAVKTEGKRLFVLYKEFKVGTTKREEV